MPFDGAGTYSPPGADFPAVPNTLIESAKFNNVINDIATALSTCITSDGQSTISQNIPGSGFALTDWRLRAIDGAVGTPSISFANDSDCGFFRLGANSWAGAIGGNEVIIFGHTASAVNEFTMTNAAMAGTPLLAATGDDTNIAAQFAGKGTGAVILGQATSVGVKLAADQPILDSSSNELIKFVKTASAVNELTITNAATGNAPVLSATGGDANIDITLTPKGSGEINISKVDIDSGAIDGTAIGGNAAAAGSFSNVSTTTFTATGVVNGGSLAPTSTTQPTNGLYLPSAGIPAMSANGFKVMEWRKPAADNGGNVSLVIYSNAGITQIHYGVSNAGYNGAVTAVHLGCDNTTSRSINAAGTLNASGADYAEYEYKRPDCGPIAKGQIIGYDQDGFVTDQWALAVTFGVKSTNPSYVGGDAWGSPTALSMARPLEPAAPAPVGPVPATKDKAILAAWKAESARVSREMALYVKAHNKWEEENARFVAKLEAARQKVDRIAYSGKVPVNVLGAKPGQWIIPTQDGEGIKGTPSAIHHPSAIGRVRRILSDGRAEIAVIVG